MLHFNSSDLFVGHHKCTTCYNQCNKELKLHSGQGMPQIHGIRIPRIGAYYSFSRYYVSFTSLLLFPVWCQYIPLTWISYTNHIPKISTALWPYYHFSKHNMPFLILITPKISTTLGPLYHCMEGHQNNTVCAISILSFSFFHFFYPFTL